MKEKKFDKSRLIIFIGVALFTVTIIILSKLWFSKNETPNFDRNYKVLIKIDAVSEDDREESHSLEVVNLKNGSKVTGDFYQRPIYIDGERTIFDAGSKYKYYNSKELSVRFLDDIIGKIDLGSSVEIEKDKISYNPLVSADMINSLLDVLFIDKEYSRDEYAFLVLKNKKIVSFSLYLVGVDGYKDMNINMTFSEVDNRDYFEMPVFYGEVMDKIDEKEIMVIR